MSDKEVLKYFYENCKTNFIIEIHSKNLSEKLNLSDNELFKCLNYMVDKKFISDIRFNKWNEPLEYKIEPIAIELVESDFK